MHPGLLLMLHVAAATPEPLEVAWIGQSTTVIRMGSHTLLTDPVYAPTMFHGLFHARFVPGIPEEQLPHPEIVLLSHLHDDHFDPESLRRVPGREAAVLLVPRGSMPYLPDDLGFSSIVELEPWAGHDLDGVHVTAVPIRHMGGTYGYDAIWNRSYTGYLVEAAGRRVLFIGDTAFSRAKFEAIATRGPFDLAMLPIAPVKGPLLSFMHAGPKAAFRILEILGAPQMVPLHYGTYWSRDAGAVRRFDQQAKATGRGVRAASGEWIQVP